MTLGRTSSGAIKIKTDEAGGGLRAVECACCGGCGCSLSFKLDENVTQASGSFGFTITDGFENYSFGGSFSVELETTSIGRNAYFNVGGTEESYSSGGQIFYRNEGCLDLGLDAGGFDGTTISSIAASGDSPPVPQEECLPTDLFGNMTGTVNNVFITINGKRVGGVFIDFYAEMSLVGNATWDITFS
jgi:hypothetical protein